MIFNLSLQITLFNNESYGRRVFQRIENSCSEQELLRFEEEVDIEDKSFEPIRP